MNENPDMPDHLIYDEISGLPTSVKEILHHDVWLYEHITSAMVKPIDTPVKFSATACIFVRKGSCKTEIDLNSYRISGPALVIIEAGHIMKPDMVSDDFEGAFLVLSKKFVSKFIRVTEDPELISFMSSNPVISIPPHLTLDFELLLKNLRRNLDDTDNRYSFQTLFFTIMAFFFQTAMKCLMPLRQSASRSNHITTRFMRLAQESFHRERFLAYYARELQITPKHLSRTVKADTGVSASEWLDRLIVLEAKVLLRSSSLNIQQIADRLNFPSQSFFGKYFKKNVGISPKEYRNT